MNVYALLDKQWDCIMDDPPPCACACPLHLDIKGLISKMRIGSASAAYKLYTKEAVLPGVTCHICDEPCQNACVRNEVGESISLKELERFCWKQNKDRPAQSFYIPKKDKKVLIVGGGPAGLSCAVKLAGRGYDVTLKEQTARLGGRLWQIDAARLPRDVLEEDIRRATDQKYLTILLNTEVTALDTDTYDAVLIATGENGAHFDASSTSGVLAAGTLVNPEQNPLSSIKQGIDSALILENYMKTGRMEPLPETRPCAFRPAMKNIPPQAIVKAEDPNAWTMDEAKAEASRCLECACSNCSDVCEMLQYYRLDAKKMMQYASDTVNKSYMNRKTGLRQIMSCTQCGLCAPACPVGIDFKDLCIESRRFLHKSGFLPDAHYDYWLSDMHHANGPDAALQLPTTETCKYVFFPGCQMGASDPDYVKRSYRWLDETFPNEAALLLSCCGAPADWAGNKEAHKQVIDEINAVWHVWKKPAFILPCPTCGEMFAKHLPQIQTISLWEVLSAHYPPAGHSKETVSIFDPCSSKYDEKAQQSIRTLVDKAGYTIEELPAAGKDARCCGYGGLVYTTNAELTEIIAQNNRALGGKEYITYCTNCRDSFAIHNKPSRHILDVLFFSAQERDLRKPPNLGQRRQNRVILKRHLQEEFLGFAPEEIKADWEEITLIISDEMQQQLNRLLILEETIQQIVFFAESTQNKVCHAHDGSYTAHLMQGMLTFWARYKPNDDGTYALLNAYAHRMNIKENETHAER